MWVRGTVLVHHVVPGSDAHLDAPSARLPSPPEGRSRGTPTSGPREPGPPRGDARPPGVTLAEGVSQVCADFVTEVCRRFALHLQGVEVSYGGIEIDPGTLTPFESNLTDAARAIPWGQVVSYGELATLAGRPKAARAAGSFCARGGLSLLVPYHRVVAASGIGGYGSDGLPLKRRLLALEGVVM